MARFDTQAAGLAIDSRGLEALKQRARDDPKAAAAGAAKQFEALLMQQLMKAMREASPPSEGPLSSDSQKTWTGMFDREIAEKIAGRGIGLASALQKQIERQIAARSGATAPAETTPAKTSAAPATSHSVASALSTTAARASSGVADTVRKFADEVRPHAEAAAKKLGVSADWLIAQAGLETGWGKHQPKNTDGTPSHNLFGIKAGTKWGGSQAIASTLEVVNGVAQPVVAAFRAYSSYADSFKDYAKLLGGARYAQAVGNAADAKSFATGLQNAGYATDPAYAKKLERAIALVGRHAPSTQFSVAAADKPSAPLRGA
jgi:flagellar protein FlgJ